MKKFLMAAVLVLFVLYFVALVAGFLWSTYSLVTDFRLHLMTVDAFSSFDLHVFIFGFALGFFIYMANRNRIHRRTIIAAVGVLVLIGLGIFVGNIITTITITPLVFYIGYFLLKGVIAFFVALYI